jgi:hypothetical protein
LEEKINEKNLTDFHKSQQLRVDIQWKIPTYYLTIAKFLCHSSLFILLVSVAIYLNYLIFVLSFDGTGVCTQGFTVAKQALYCFSHTSQLIYLNMRDKLNMAFE